MRNLIALTFILAVALMLQRAVIWIVQEWDK